MNQNQHQGFPGIRPGGPPYQPPLPIPGRPQQQQQFMQGPPGQVPTFRPVPYNPLQGASQPPVRGPTWSQGNMNQQSQFNPMMARPNIQVQNPQFQGPIKDMNEYQQKQQANLQKIQVQTQQQKAEDEKAKKSTKMYVGQIAQTVEGEFIQKLLQVCGEINSWQLVQDPSTKVSKGFGFVEFKEPQGVIMAQALLNELHIDGLQLVLKALEATQKYVEEYKRQQRMENQQKSKETNAAEGDSNLEVQEELKLQEIMSLISERALTKKTSNTKSEKDNKKDEKESSHHDRSHRDKSHRDRHRDKSRDRERDREHRKDKKEKRRDKSKEQDQEDLQKEIEREIEIAKQESAYQKKKKSEGQYEQQLKDWEKYERDKQKKKENNKEKQKDIEKERQRIIKGDLEIDDMQENEPTHKRKKPYRLSKRAEERRKRRKIEEHQDEIDRQQEEQENQLNKVFKQEQPQKAFKPNKNNNNNAYKLNSNSDVKVKKDESNDIEQTVIKKEEKVKEETRQQNRDYVKRNPTDSPNQNASKKIKKNEADEKPAKEEQPQVNQQPPQTLKQKSNQNFSQGFIDPHMAIQSHQQALNQNSQQQKPQIGLGIKATGAIQSDNKQAAKKGNLNIFGEEEEQKAEHKLVQIPNMDNQIKSNGQKQDAKEALKRMIDKIPATVDKIVQYPIKWHAYQPQGQMGHNIKEWLRKKSSELLGGTEEPSFVEHILQNLRDHKSPKDMLKEIQYVLEDESNTFVLKLYRMIIFETEKEAISI